MMPELPPRRPLEWVGSSLDDLRAFPSPVRLEMGFALHLAQIGEKADSAKPLHGFGSAGVLEIVSDYRGDTYRGVYTVWLSGVIYVLHAFQKKSKRGRETPKADIELIGRRLRLAEDHYQRNYGGMDP